MPAPGLPPDWTNTIKSILKRITNLENRGIGNNMTIHTSAEQRGINIYDDTNNVEVARFGKLQDSNSDTLLNFVSYGLVVFNSALSNITALWFDFTKGIIYPNLAWPWKKSLDNVSTTSGSFVNAWETAVNAIPSAWIRFSVDTNVDTSCTGELRVLVNGVQLGNAQAFTGNQSFTFIAAHGVNIGTGIITIALQIRRTGGANNVYVYAPYPLHFGDPKVTSIPAGNWQ